jgi:threonylcarbamoyladenosine tRNA methylthiotransferase MtaB
MNSAVIKDSSIITYGCRLNSIESQVISDHLSSLKRSDNVIVVHSCAVTKNAEKESYDKVKELVKKNGSLDEASKKKIFVTGCSVQLNPDKYLSLGVDRVIGNADKLNIDSYRDENHQKIWRDIMDVRAIKDLPQTARIEGKTRGLVQIQNGCDHDCTFCVIYKARGKNRSVTLVEVIDQIKILVNAGYTELVLTGVDITDYGKDLSPSLTLGKLIKKIFALVPNILRLRLSSIDVAEIDDELFEVMSSENRVMPYFHLSMQSGSDMILKRMKRRHLSDDIDTFCKSMLEKRSDSVFGADIIAGFPTETNEFFDETVNLISKIPNFLHLHIFPFSAHSGTPASKMPQVNGKIIKERAKILRDIGQKNLINFSRLKIGSTEDVLFESKNFGRTDQFIKVALDEIDSRILNSLSGKIVKIKISDILIDSSYRKDGFLDEKFSFLKGVLQKD